MNKTLVKSVRTIIAHAKLPNMYWLKPFPPLPTCEIECPRQQLKRIKHPTSYGVEGNPTSVTYEYLGAWFMPTFLIVNEESWNDVNIDASQADRALN